MPQRHWKPEESVAGLGTKSSCTAGAFSPQHEYCTPSFRVRYCIGEANERTLVRLKTHACIGRLRMWFSHQATMAGRRRRISSRAGDAHRPSAASTSPRR